MKYLSIRRLVLPLIASLAACGGDPVDLGENRAVGSALSDYAGTWDGYAEAFEFADGTDTVRLVLGDDGTGELSFGEVDPLSPPEADRAYPPSENWTLKESIPYGVYAGFPYPIDDGTVDDSRIQMHSSAVEVYREWCDLQTPHLLQSEIPNRYACLPTSRIGSNENGDCTLGDDSEDVIDCGVSKCLGYCECTADDCAVSQADLLPNMRLDAKLEGDGDDFVGTLVLGSERIIVRLTRM